LGEIALLVSVRGAGTVVESNNVADKR